MNSGDRYQPEPERFLIRIPTRSAIHISSIQNPIPLVGKIDLAIS